MPTWLHKDKPSSDALFDVSRGAYSNASLIHKFGANYDIDDTSTPETVWSVSNAYPWDSLATDQTLYCLSTAAGDTNDLEIQGLDANWNLQTEVITLTGTTAVTTTNTFLRVFRMRYLGTSANTGTVTVRVTSGTGTIVGQIDADIGQTLMAIYSVPAGHTAYLMGGDITVDANKVAQLDFKIRLFGEFFRTQHTAEVTGIYDKTFRMPLPIPEKSDIDVMVSTVASPNTRASANFDLILVKD